MADEKSTTWSAHLRTLCLKYKLPDPLELLQNGKIWDKTKWTTMTTTLVTVHFERSLREEAKRNSKMQNLNVQVQGLSGAPHPALLNVKSMQDVQKIHHHLKILTGDFRTAERLALNNGTSPQCKLCLAPVESTAHALTECSATSDIHSHMLPELLNTVLQVQPNCTILYSPTHPQWLTQFILDCTSPNLPALHRVAAHNPCV